MGRTVPTFVQLIQEAAEHWQKFRRALRREDQPHFDRLFTRVRCYTQAATYQAHDNPMEAILLSIAVFSDATSFKTKRRDFFQRLRNQAEHVVKVESTPDNKLSFTREKHTPLLPA